jgi:hypothetical protein
LSLSPYEGKQRQFCAATIQTVKKEFKAGVFSVGLLEWITGDPDSKFTPHGLARKYGMSVRSAQGGLKKACGLGLVRILRPACHARRRAATYCLATKAPKWKDVVNCDNNKFKEFQTQDFSPKRVLPTEEKKGPIAPTTDSEPGSELLQPPLAGGDVFAHVTEEITIPEYLPEDFQTPEPEARIEKPVVKTEIRHKAKAKKEPNPKSEPKTEAGKALEKVLSVSEVSLTGAKKAACIAESQGRIEKALELTRLAVAWVPSAAWLNSKPGYLYSVAIGKISEERLRKNLEPRRERKQGGGQSVPALTVKPPDPLPQKPRASWRERLGPDSPWYNPYPD